MLKHFPVLVGTTWEKSRRVDHYRLYGTTRGNAKDRNETMVFDGMDGVVIDDAPSTRVKGCWADVKGQPGIIEELVGPKGLAFLELLADLRLKTSYVTTPVRGRRKKVEVLFTEVRVVSAWQFSVVSSQGFNTQRLTLSALRKYLGKIPRKHEWVLA